MTPNSNSNLQCSFSPGLEDVHVWISIPFCLMYFISILGNSFIMFIIKTDPTLHEPMYIFLSMLAITELGLSISTLPTTLLGIYLFKSTEISHDSCFVQLFFIHSLMYTESSVLLSMVLSHSYYLNQELMTMACSDFSVNIIYGFFITVSTRWLDLLLILLSYVMILKTVLSLTSHTAHLKALNTCISHVCIVLLFYMPGVGLSVIYRLMNMSSALVQIVLGNDPWLIPPLMKSIVYSMKTKPIRARIIRVFIK